MDHRRYGPDAFSDFMLKRKRDRQGLETLSVDILRIVFNCLHIEENASIRRTCRKFNDVAKHPCAAPDSINFAAWAQVPLSIVCAPRHLSCVDNTPTVLDEQQMARFQFTRLQTIRLDAQLCSAVSLPTLQRILTAKHLVKLHLDSYTSMTIQHFISALGHATVPLLRHLHLGHINDQDDVVQPVLSMTNIQELVKVPMWDKLQTLELPWSPLSDTQLLVLLASCTTLHSLVLSLCGPIAEDFMPQLLTRLPQLTSLELLFCGLPSSSRVDMAHTLLATEHKHVPTKLHTLSIMNQFHYSQILTPKVLSHLCVVAPSLRKLKVVTTWNQDTDHSFRIRDAATGPAATLQCLTVAGPTDRDAKFSLGSDLLACLPETTANSLERLDAGTAFGRHQFYYPTIIRLTWVQKHQDALSVIVRRFPNLKALELPGMWEDTHIEQISQLRHLEELNSAPPYTIPTHQLALTQTALDMFLTHMPRLTTLTMRKVPHELNMELFKRVFRGHLEFTY